jgi:hypothetical protein
MTTLLLYASLTYHWGGSFAAEVGPELWVTAPNRGVALMWVAPAVLVIDSTEPPGMESRLTTWLVAPPAGVR